MKKIKVSDTLFNYLISNVSGEVFEFLAKKIFSAISEEEFFPLGGMHDGGADGYYLPQVCEGKKPSTFYQFSITDSGKAKSKITETIKSLQKVGRTPKQVIYATNQKLPKQDTWVSDIFEEYTILLTVWDLERIQHEVSSNPKVTDIFLGFFAAEIDVLKDDSKSFHGAVNQFIDDPIVFAYLDYELKDRYTKDHLHEKILDSLIYWVLRDTDPITNKFLGRKEIRDAIERIFPKATSTLIPHLNKRLKELSQKDAGGMERIRHHTKDDLFCLPFEMRKQLAERAVDEVSLQDNFSKSINDRLLTIIKEPLNEDTRCLVIDIIFDSVHEYFIEQGLILSAYLNNKVKEIQISDQIVEDQVKRVLAKSKSKASISPLLVANCMLVLRGIFYDPSEIERRYLGYLSRTSLLFNTLQFAPRLIEYFNKMGGNFRLLVGTDMLVKAISEENLSQEKRQVESLLRACMDLGATLILAEPVLNEVFTHLHAVDLEYKNHYLPNEAYLSPDDISECDRILIRSYYYARNKNGMRMSWEKFINNLIDIEELRNKSEAGRNQLRDLLALRFQMDFLSEEEMKNGVNHENIHALAHKLIEARFSKNKELSHNDALMVFATYSQRRKHKESAIYDGFGYRTWWLTKETQILNFTEDLVEKEGGIPYIMRPEFLLNFIVLAPNAAHVREVFREFLPTTVGLQLGQHLSSETMQQLLQGAVEHSSLTPERISVKLSSKINKLKYARFKEYTSNLDIKIRSDKD